MFAPSGLPQLGLKPAAPAPVPNQTGKAAAVAATGASDDSLAQQQASRVVCLACQVSTAAPKCRSRAFLASLVMATESSWSWPSTARLFEADTNPKTKTPKPTTSRRRRRRRTTRSNDTGCLAPHRQLVKPRKCSAANSVGRPKLACRLV